MELKQHKITKCNIFFVLCCFRAEKIIDCFTSFVISLIVAENLVKCIQENNNDGSNGEESLQQSINLLMKSR